MSEERKSTNRRTFIRMGVAGVAGLSAGALKGQEPEKKTPSGKEETNPHPIPRRKLGRTGIEVPILSMGAQAEDPAVYRAAAKAGITHFDTAETYNRGQHEEMLAEAMKDFPREQLLIGTKVYMHADQKTGLYPKNLSISSFYEKFEGSLKRLKMDYVDILYIHSVTSAGGVSCAPLMEALVKLKKEGKTRAIGLSTHTNEAQVIDAAREAKVYEVILTSYNFLQPHSAEMQRAIEQGAKAGIGFVAMKTQAGVFYDRERKEPIPMKAALKWALSNPHIATAIAGFTTFDQLEEDLAAVQDLSLSAEEKKGLRLVEGKAGLYCSQCRQCLDQCPHSLSIPDYMRAYMYAYGYRNLSKAYQTLSEFKGKAVPCTECPSCTVTCAKQFDVKMKVLDVARISNIPEDILT
ncbi:MAG TPA: aldo/keto reductase [Thermoanaerobaculia bacterium]|nr:aldo/keto reductase [Thermoanaerobaculia bacterium]HXK66924.1 aldo/keto reductase [Thermoanaerobaculia bacterium]